MHKSFGMICMDWSIGPIKWLHIAHAVAAKIVGEGEVGGGHYCILAGSSGKLPQHSSKDGVQKTFIRKL